MLLLMPCLAHAVLRYFVEAQNAERQNVEIQIAEFKIWTSLFYAPTLAKTERT
jgi:hypothetical protein